MNSKRNGDREGAVMARSRENLGVAANVLADNRLHDSEPGGRRITDAIAAVLATHDRLLRGAPARRSGEGAARSAEARFGLRSPQETPSGAIEASWRLVSLYAAIGEVIDYCAALRDEVYREMRRSAGTAGIGEATQPTLSP